MRKGIWIPAQYDENGNFVPAHNEWVEMTQEEIDARNAEYAAEAGPRLSKSLEALWRAAMKYQEKSCDSNFYGLLMAIKSSIEPTPTKAAACLAWLDSLWVEYYTRKAAVTSESPANTDFSSVGSCPHTFAEVRAEAEAV